MNNVSIPIQDINGEKWVIIGHIGSKIVFRADSIDKRNKRVQDPNGHRMDEAVAEGSIKCKPRKWDTSGFTI